MDEYRMPYSGKPIPREARSTPDFQVTPGKSAANRRGNSSSSCSWMFGNSMAFHGDIFRSSFRPSSQGL